MEELDKIVDDYINDCFHNDNVRPYATESIQAWWKANREMYDSEIVEIIHEEVNRKLMNLIFEEDRNKDLSKN